MHELVEDGVGCRWSRN